MSVLKRGGVGARLRGAVLLRRRVRRRRGRLPLADRDPQHGPPRHWLRRSSPQEVNSILVSSGGIRCRSRAEWGCPPDIGPPAAADIGARKSESERRTVRTAGAAIFRG